MHSLRANISVIQRLLLLAWLAGETTVGRLEAAQIDAAPAEVVETGAPAYELLTNESLGLNTAPTDLREMPDGRILLVAGMQLALGDGVRWQVYQQGGNSRVPATGAAVDRDGSIYVGMPEGVARVVFGEDGRWRPQQVVAWSIPGDSNKPILPQAMITEAGGEWIWHSLTGPLLSWRPGREMKFNGPANTIEHVFDLDGKRYISERSDGTLSRVQAGQKELIKAEGALSAVTASQPYATGRALVGTYGRGLQLFDGSSMKKFAADEVFESGGRINDLCRTERGFFAAAVDSFGIVFFDAKGRTVQVLDRSSDTRFARIKRLICGRGGIVWGILDSGAVRVQFPASVSHLEAYFAQGVTTTHPYRSDGKLWMRTDGRLYRALYDRAGRMVGLHLDSPAGLFVNAFSNVSGLLVAGTEHGAYVRSAQGWKPFAPDARHLHIVADQPVQGRWLYTAKGEVGWLQRQGDTLVRSGRRPVPGVGNVYNKPLRDSAGRLWLEMGSGRIGYVQLQGGEPRVRIFTEQDGLPPSWPQLFLQDNAVISANIADRIWRFDEAAERFIPDELFLSRVPGAKQIFGRPGIDPQGRLWIVVDGNLQIRRRRGEQWSEVLATVPIGFAPYYLTFEDNGVTWMHAQHRLARFDPRLPLAAPLQLGARFTELRLAGGRRHLFDLDDPLPELPYEENSLVARFAAVGNAFGAAINFEVRLDDETEGVWVSAGSSGVTNLGPLKEGSYVLRVRPRVGATLGYEDSIAFSIRAPWYRTPWAYFSYVVLGAVLIWLMVWISTLVERSEKVRLERLVAERTSELNHTMDEIRVLTQAITQSPVALFITSPEGIIEYTNPRSCLLTGSTASQLVGENLNRLRPNSISEATRQEIDTTLARGESWTGELTIEHRDGRHIPVRSTISPISGPDGRVRHHLILEDDITEWMQEQDRRRRLEAQLAHAQKIESIGTFAGGIAHDFNNILTGILGYCELARLNAQEKADVTAELQQIRAAGLRAKDLVSQILTFSRKHQVTQVAVDLRRPVEEALNLLRATTPATVELVQHLQSGTVRADASQIHQIVINLCTNAIHAIGERRGRLAVTLEPVQVDERLAAQIPSLQPGVWMHLKVADTGEGMDAATLERIFDPFFTTKSKGKGTGLGLSIVQGVVMGHGGAMQVSSQPGVGTTFDLWFPTVDEPVVETASVAVPVRGAGEEILLVDDEPLVAEFALVRLSHFGYRPVYFTDPREALAAFRAAPARFTAIVTDLTMPHLTGLDLVGEVRSVRKNLPAIILTGYGDESTRARISSLPLCALLQKPFSGEDLALLLSQLITRRGGSNDPSDHPEMQVHIQGMALWTP